MNFTIWFELGGFLKRYVKTTYWNMENMAATTMQIAAFDFVCWAVFVFGETETKNVNLKSKFVVNLKNKHSYVY